MEPPWKACPDIEHGSIGWRMGRGEEIYDMFYRWFSDLSEVERARFEAEHPEPKQWKGFYRMIAESPWKSN